MHIPDGLLDLRTSAAAGLLAAAGLIIALHAARNSLPARRIPYLGLTAAFVFAAQMLNFPIAAGTSGHLIGAALCAILLGPSAAIVVLSCVLIVQCLLLADGGLLALGANIFNLAIVPAIAASVTYRIALECFPRAPIPAAALAAWLSTILAAAACSGELALSGLAPPSVLFPSLIGVHAVIGIGEAIITALILTTLAQHRPDLLIPPVPPTPSAPITQPAPIGAILLGLLAITGLVIFIAPFACPWPDGLEHVVESLGLTPTSPHHSSIPASNESALTAAIAAATGTVGAYALALLAAHIIARPATPVRESAR